MGLNTFMTQRDSTNKQHLVWHECIPQLVDGQFSLVFFFSVVYAFLSACIISTRGMPEADLAKPRAFCLLSGNGKPAGGRSGLLSEATWTSWWSWVAVGHPGPVSSVDVCVSLCRLSDQNQGRVFLHFYERYCTKAKNLNKKKKPFSPDDDCSNSEK